MVHTQTKGSTGFFKKNKKVFFYYLFIYIKNTRFSSNIFSKKRVFCHKKKVLFSEKCFV